MRKIALFATASLLSACGGGGGAPPATPGGAPPPVGGQAGHTFVAPTQAKTYNAIGGSHTFAYNTSNYYAGQRAQLYQGNASTARNSGIVISYDPRDAIFEVKVKDPLSGTNNSLRFQDPVHRTDFGGEDEPQIGTPNLNKPGIQYLQGGSAEGQVTYLNRGDMLPVGEVGAKVDRSTFFVQKPGSDTKFVTFAGFVRNTTEVIEEEDPATEETYEVQVNTLERAAFAYGERTVNAAIPRTGTGTFNGAMIATMVYNPTLDTSSSAPTYFQWIDGSALTKVNFATNSFEIDLNGKVFAPQFDNFTNRDHVIRAGAVFNANGKGRIDLVQAGGFVGDFQNAWFVNPNGGRHEVVIAGSSVDGAFFGPNAQEVGGGFRIVGGTPDERVDILGTFVGR